MDTLVKYVRRVGTICTLCMHIYLGTNPLETTCQRVTCFTNSATGNEPYINTLCSRTLHRYPLLRVYLLHIYIIYT